MESSCGRPKSNRVRGQRMVSNRKLVWLLISLIVLMPSGLFARKTTAADNSAKTAQAKTIGFSIDSATGSYAILDPSSRKPILRSRVAAEVDHHWARSSDYPQHSVSQSSAAGPLGSTTKLTVTDTGLAGQPDLIYSLELHENPDFVTVDVAVRNSGTKQITVQALRTVEAIAP